MPRSNPYKIYVWYSLGLWHAQAFDEGDLDPSEVYVSVDRSDALQQAGYEPRGSTAVIEDRPKHPFGAENF